MKRSGQWVIVQLWQWRLEHSIPSLLVGKMIEEALKRVVLLSKA